MELSEFDNPDPGIEPLPAFLRLRLESPARLRALLAAKGRQRAAGGSAARRDFSPAEPPPGLVGGPLRLECWADNEGVSVYPDDAQLAAFRSVVEGQDALLDAIADALRSFSGELGRDLSIRAGARFPETGGPARHPGGCPFAPRIPGDLPGPGGGPGGRRRRVLRERSLRSGARVRCPHPGRSHRRSRGGDHGVVILRGEPGPPPRHGAWAPSRDPPSSRGSGPGRRWRLVCARLSSRRSAELLC